MSTAVPTARKGCAQDEQEVITHFAAHAAAQNAQMRIEKRTVSSDRTEKDEAKLTAARQATQKSRDRLAFSRRKLKFHNTESGDSTATTKRIVSDPKGLVHQILYTR